MKLKIKKLIISFKKHLRSDYPFHKNIAFLIENFKEKSSQSTIEYFVILTIIAAITVIGLSTFFPRVQASFNEVQNAALERVIHADGDNSY